MRLLELQIPARDAPLPGGATVRRALPRRERRRVGPFVFLDHMGPFEGAVDVPAHPHVGLQTVTWLYEGHLLHRDSTGAVQEIRPGEVNWMTAGRGVVHEEVAATPGRFHGLQAWVAQPPARRGGPPSFLHVGREAVPVVYEAGVEVRILAGTLLGATSPAPTEQPTLFADLRLDPGATFDAAVPAEFELAIYVAAGDAQIGDARVVTGTLGVLGAGKRLRITSEGGARIALIGGEPAPEPVVVWWNFVVDSVAAGQAEEARWKAGAFDPIPP